MKRYLKRKSFWFLTVIFLGIGFATLARLDEVFPDEAPGMPVEKAPVLVKVETITKGDVREWVVGAGTARAIRRAFLNFRQPGKVVYIAGDIDGLPLREGARVRGPRNGERLGQLIAHIDKREQTQNVKMGKAKLVETARNTEALNAELARARKALSFSKTNLSRFEALKDNGAVPEAELDAQRASFEEARQTVKSLEAQLDAARAGVKGAEAYLHQMKISKEGTAIHAPFDGIVAFLNIRIGDYVNPMSQDTSDEQAMIETSPVVLLDPSVYEVVLELPVGDGKSVEPGLPVRIDWEDGTPLGRWVGGEKEQGETDLGEVYSVSPSVNPGGRSVRVKVRTTGDVGGVRDGMFATCRIETNHNPNALMAPISAIQKQRDGNVVYVVDPDTKEVDRRMVTVGRGLKGDTKIEVRGGLEAGELVITEGRDLVAPGDIVDTMQSDWESQS